MNLTKEGVKWLREYMHAEFQKPVESVHYPSPVTGYVKGAMAERARSAAEVENLREKVQRLDAGCIRWKDDLQVERLKEELKKWRDCHRCECEMTMAGSWVECQAHVDLENALSPDGRPSEIHAISPQLSNEQLSENAVKPKESDQ